MTFVRQYASGGKHQQALHTEKSVSLDQSTVKSAGATKDQAGRPQIWITFADEGRRRFAEVTRDNIGKSLAIIVDGRICSAPVIQEKISGGKAQITGHFSEQEAKDLAQKINAAVAK